MRDWNTGETRNCVCCGRSYWCSDGDWVCSSECQDEMDACFVKDQLEDLEIDLENMIDDYITRDLSEMEFKRKWNMRIYKIGTMVDEDEFMPVVNKLQKEYDLEC